MAAIDHLDCGFQTAVLQLERTFVNYGVSDACQHLLVHLSIPSLYDLYIIFVGQHALFVDLANRDPFECSSSILQLLDKHLHLV